VKNKVNLPAVSERRSYQQFCGLARALDRVGERWTLLIVRNLLLGPRRYSDLLRELPGITTNLLAKRLKELEGLGILQRDSGPGRAEAYALTELGEALEPAVMELARWGGHFMDAPASGDRLDIGWGLLSMKRRYRGSRSLIVALEITEAGERERRVFELHFEPTRLGVKERLAVRPDLALSGSEAAFRALFWGGARGDVLRSQGALVQRAGDDAAFEGFVTAFD
jgi:DNA-binding HxlR family transcriptional regulator